MWLWLDGCLCMGIRQWERWKRGQVLSRQRLPLYKECVFCGFSGQEIVTCSRYFSRPCTAGKICKEVKQKKTGDEGNCPVFPHLLA